jgi:hypothetical protein
MFMRIQPKNLKADPDLCTWRTGLIITEGSCTDIFLNMREEI